MTDAPDFDKFRARADLDKAPERIWLWRDGDRRCVSYLNEPAPQDSARYVRADLHAAVVAERDVLREALEMCPPDRPQMPLADFREAVNAWWRLWARPALAKQEPKE